MTGFALIDALPDFGAPRRAQPRAVEEIRPQPAAQRPAPIPVVETFTREELEHAAEEARALTEQRLEAAHEIEKASIAADHQTEIERLRREMGEQAGTAIAARFAELEANLSAATNGVVTRILGVALSEEVTRDAVDQLANALNAALSDRETVRLRIQGPLSLYEALRPALGSHAERAEFVETAGLDISVALETSLFETRIAEWSSALADALAGTRS